MPSQPERKRRPLVFTKVVAHLPNTVERLHDKLLLILSELSVQSAWVQYEVEAALERERREKRLVLFPIRIDDAVMETQQAWQQPTGARVTSGARPLPGGN